MGNAQKLEGRCLPGSVLISSRVAEMVPEAVGTRLVKSASVSNLQQKEDALHAFGDTPDANNADARGKGKKGGGGGKEGEGGEEGEGDKEGGNDGVSDERGDVKVNGGSRSPPRLFGGKTSINQDDMHRDVDRNHDRDGCVDSSKRKDSGSPRLLFNDRNNNNNMNQGHGDRVDGSFIKRDNWKRLSAGGDRFTASSLSAFDDFTGEIMNVCMLVFAYI